jgi:Periplasmic copper-binding protein (NosD)
MTPRNPRTFERRQFLRTASGLAAGAFGAALARADELPKNMNSRAIAGDTVEPDWRQRLSITVGSQKADLVGATDRVIQAAVGLRRAAGRRHRACSAGHLPDAQLGFSPVESPPPGERSRLGAGEGTVRRDQAHRRRRSLGSGGQPGRRLAVHSGSGSQRSIVRGNRMLRSAEGIYFCWGAQHGFYEKNVIEDCSYGITIGHRDSDNLIRDNDIRRSGQAGIHFRDDDGKKAFSPHRNRIERNRIIDSGPEKGVAIDVNGETESVTLIKNDLRETRKPASRIGIRIGAKTRDIRYVDNRIEGFATAISDLRKT